MRLLEVYPPCREVFADLVIGLPAGDLAEFADNDLARATLDRLWEASNADDGESARAVRNIRKAVRLLDEQPPCLLYTSPSPRDRTRSRMPSSA